MPAYDYRCPKCGVFTINQRIIEKALVECPTCGSSVKRIISKNVNVIYKCSGFYCKDTHSNSGNLDVNNKSDSKTATTEKTDTKTTSDNKCTENTKGTSSIKSISDTKNA
ncbi:MAG: zinc ribbon domain-containing protein [Clostridia bacterium]|nr:zinc ribbon domain-containing protein [Clostridia bacterium]MDD4047758.1 zinc ribbon domain-containing protein [Clostridia bacterium]